jgi:uncharacterized protein with HEPN domain
MDKIKRYETNSDFLEFLNSEFDKTAVDATIEEIAEFAFGSIEEAIKDFEERRKK